MRWARLAVYGGFAAAVLQGSAARAETGPSEPPARVIHLTAAADPASGETPPWTGMLDGPAPECSPPSFWVGVDYLCWRLRGATPPPLVSTGNPFDLSPGALGQSGTRVLYGGTRDSFGTVNGLRVNFGTYFDPCRATGLEASVFVLEPADTGFAAASTAGGVPPLYLPSFRPELGREGVVTVASPEALPGIISGQVVVTSRARLWGAQAGYVQHLTDYGPARVSGLVGLQYLDLAESLRLRAAVDDREFDIQTRTEDLFETRNRFYGATVGARVGMAAGPFTADLTGRLGVGATQRTADVSGVTALGGSGCVLCGLPNGGTFPGGVFSQPTNIGRDSECGFAVVPQLQLRLGYAVCPNVRLTAGYDVLWWTEVVRPADRVDRVTNLTQRFGFSLAGPARPARLDGTSDFRAHGLSVGVEVQY